MTSNTTSQSCAFIMYCAMNQLIAKTILYFGRYNSFERKTFQREIPCSSHVQRNIKIIPNVFFQCLSGYGFHNFSQKPKIVIAIFVLSTLWYNRTLQDTRPDGILPVVAYVKVSSYRCGKPGLRSRTIKISSRIAILIKGGFIKRNERYHTGLMQQYVFQSQICFVRFSSKR